MSVFHVPVMVKEVIEALDVVPGKRYIDATVGGGGHGVEIVKRGGILLGIDADREAVAYTISNIKYQISNKQEGKDWKIIQEDFRDIEKIAKENGFEKVDGILFDLGVSSYQLDTPVRGFSYRFADAPLDLRFDQTEGMPAAELINKLNEGELYEIFARFGEEQLAGPIAHSLVRARAARPIATCGELVQVVAELVESRQLPGVLSRIFQALRIAVNDEFGALTQGLVGAKSLLKPQGRLAVISFHSLDDRKVKKFMRDKGWRLIAKKPIVPNEAEILANPRSRSAKLRIAERL